MPRQDLIVDFPPAGRNTRMNGPDYAASILEHVAGMTTSKNGKRLKSVRFLSESLLYCYEKPEVGGYSSWYTRDEEYSFKLQAKADIDLFNAAKETEDFMPTGACPIGLEHQLISTDHAKKRIMTKLFVENAVLAEQARPGDDKVERIASASMLHSEWSREQARTIGSFHAKHVKKLL